MASKAAFIPHPEYPYAKIVEVPSPEMKILEISTRSDNVFGKTLSPFNLAITLKSGKRVKVECAYQGSKVLPNGEQFPLLYWGSPRDAALDKRIKGKRPAAFKFFGKPFPTQPKHAFFDWLYMVALIQRKDDVFQKLNQFDGFSDMFYSPRKDPNCQGRAAAKFVALNQAGIIDKNISSRELLEILVGKK